MWLFERTQASEIQTALATRVRDGAADVRIHALLRTISPDALVDDTATVHETRMPDDAASYARALYAALHDADTAGAGLVLIEAPPADDSHWDGVRDRLTRAAR